MDASVTANRWTYVWWMLSGILCVYLWIFHLHRDNDLVGERFQNQPSPLTDIKDPRNAFGVVNEPPIRFDQMVPSIEIARLFVENESLEDKIHLLRDQEDASPLRVHFARMATERREQVVEDLTPLPSARTHDVVFDRYRVTFADGNERLLAIVHGRSGITVDWPTYQRQCEASWSDLVSGKVAKASMRLIVQRSDYHNHAFSDVKAFESYELTSPDWDEGPLFGYVKRGSARARMLAQTVRGGSSQRMTLRLKRDSESPRAFEITKLIAGGWVQGATDYEDSAFAVHLPSSLDKEWRRRQESLHLRDLPELSPMPSFDQANATTGGAPVTWALEY